ncbi:MAG: hypothetical protein PHX70_14360 [Clostridium sp.]|nr:hypothetical protein [Clostridium sp.]
MTIKDLMVEEQEYIVEYRISENYYLYIEGLNNGCVINGKFNANNIESLLVEIIRGSNGESELLTNIDLDLEDKIENIKDYVLEQLLGRIIDIKEIL